MSQRSRAEQVQAARPGVTPKLWRMLIGMLVLLALGVAGRAYWAYAREPHLTPECAEAYANARSARDTALVDAIPVAKRDPVMRSCGMLRQLVETRRAEAHPRK